MTTTAIARTCLMFAGQGAQHVGMSLRVHAAKAATVGTEGTTSLKAASLLFEQASAVLGYDLLDTCVNGPKELLDSTVVAQPAIFVSSMAALQALAAEDVDAIHDCKIAMGLSLGEYSALCFAGAFTFEDGVRLTYARGKAMQNASDLVPTQMVSVAGKGVTVETVEEICNEVNQTVSLSATNQYPIVIANYLAPDVFSVAGSKESCSSFEAIARRRGIRSITILPVAGAFHTNYMKPAATQLEAALHDTTFQPLRLPVLANVTGTLYPMGKEWSSEKTKSLLLQQLTQPVRWDRMVESLLRDESVKRAVEVGPGSVCRGILKRWNKDFPVTTMSL